MDGSRDMARFRGKIMLFPCIANYALHRIVMPVNETIDDVCKSFPTHKTSLNIFVT